MLPQIVYVWAFVCMQGLEAQLLGIVVRKERPELEEQKDSLVISIASGKKSLQELEDEILRLFSWLYSTLFTYNLFPPKIINWYFNYFQLPLSLTQSSVPSHSNMNRY